MVLLFPEDEVKILDDVEETSLIGVWWIEYEDEVLELKTVDCESRLVVNI